MSDVKKSNLEKLKKKKKYLYITYIYLLVHDNTSSIENGFQIIYPDSMCTKASLHHIPFTLTAHIIVFK